jgi:small conductance mechanosensitive channel
MEGSFQKMLDGLFTWIATSGVKLVIGLAVLYIGWRLIKKIIKIMNTILEKKNVDNTLKSFLDAFIDISLKIILIIVVMGYVGIDTAGLAALIASAGLAVGLALQGSLSNFAGGVIILLIRPFNVGDYIEGAGHSGTVEKISIFYTSLTTPDNKQILIPNGSLANDSIVADNLQIQAKLLRKNNIVKLRWVTPNSQIWESTNKTGFKIERYTIFIVQSVVKDLLN